MAYLHPNRFRPDRQKVVALGVDPSAPYFIVRLVSWQASHDIGETGMGVDLKRQIVSMLAENGRVLITSEGDLPPDLETYRFLMPPEAMHDVMAFADILVGESATMASESAVLGIPALFISATGRGYTTEEEQRFGLVFNFKPDQGDAIVRQVNALLMMENSREVFAEKRAALLASKIDTTEWVIDYLDTVVGCARGRRTDRRDPALVPPD